MQQALANDRAKLSPEQIRARERELQERITNAQRNFRERNRVIQQAAQYGLAQIERTLVAVIRAGGRSRGMNLVLHRPQVALNVNEFDITEQVTEQLNKVLPAVISAGRRVAGGDGGAAEEQAKQPAPAPAPPAGQAGGRAGAVGRRWRPATRGSSAAPARTIWRRWRRPAARRRRQAGRG